ncbi:MAG: hypothetical protein DI538_05025 [Azospira oryzae]|nr:MAG: hypothetical protein DI538_05025 [Azospira oryzae]
METRDLIVTPLVIILVCFIAYLIRPVMSDAVNRKYFFPALTVKLIGALAVGFIYQFYYGGGDTFNYHTYGSRIIWEAFMQNPLDGFKLIINNNDPELYRYTSQIEFFLDPSSYFIVRLAALFDILTFSSYSATAVLFAFSSFIGIWFFFLSFYELFPHLHRRIAICSFFIPSVFFWGSGLLKDTIIMACLGIATYWVKRIFIDKRVSISGPIILIICLFIMFSVKKYVLLCFVPASLFWVYAGNLSMIRSMGLRILLLPFIIGISVFSGFYAMKKIGESDPKYALDKLAETARITAYDIGFYSGRDAGSGYTLGEMDGTFGGMLKLAPQAINVSLFRPYLWEVRNPLMLLSAMEAFSLFLIFVFLLFRKPRNFFSSLGNPNVLFCFVFSIAFAFAVGVSTYNFGTLSRYKIPLLPFFAMGLVLVADQINRETKFSELEETE